ncbi:undecaprenyl-diphosphate phosphatase [Methylobacterium haplocladii]|uniref:Undecaprenyl-diphosphatase n=1 Tax=Methylobacterium haplocladii TaxID=1176176 RepID=A0A512IR79_9HYPH|nr:undecaprenyl-diphosphate phosphatase [Methylobacterium haplocladii]GEP00119.1 undecaprenyl-diphosphatase [Methylobacterium haplocladii]GJD85371.1 Undecaprenyl-diphosphatase [Methylobacterium haplocladii]GLS58167.1 undecaprenyl-diphosphatase [Methylobacterium haplocladii]
MDFANILKALVLAVVEGATEFIPVSSTGHQLLIGHFIGFKSPNNTYEVLIQLGAVLAILYAYFGRLTKIATALPHDPRARRFVGSILLAFIPAAIIGGLFSKYIKLYLFNPWIVCATLVAGGLVLLVIDEADPYQQTDAEGDDDRAVRTERIERKDDVFEFSLPMALKIGFFQCLAMIPGVSRSGATIVGAMLMGASKRAATEFSFYLAMPTMAGAFAKDLLDNYKNLSTDDALVIVIGFVAAFLAALVVVRSVLDYVSKHGFWLFAWWRIIVGSLGFAGLILFG